MTRISFAAPIIGLVSLVAACDDFDRYDSFSRGEYETCEESIDCEGALLCLDGTCKSSSSSSGRRSSTSSSSSSGGSSSSSSSSSSGGSSSGGSSSGTGTHEQCAQQTVNGCTMRFCAGGPRGCYYVANGVTFQCNCQDTTECVQDAVDECSQ